MGNDADLFLWYMYPNEMLIMVSLLAPLYILYQAMRYCYNDPNLHRDYEDVLSSDDDDNYDDNDHEKRRNVRLETEYGYGRQNRRMSY